MGPASCAREAELGVGEKGENQLSRTAGNGQRGCEPHGGHGSPHTAPTTEPPAAQRQPPGAPIPSHFLVFVKAPTPCAPLPVYFNLTKIFIYKQTNKKKIVTTATNQTLAWKKKLKTNNKTRKKTTTENKTAKGGQQAGSLVSPFSSYSSRESIALGSLA